MGLWRCEKGNFDGDVLFNLRALAPIMISIVIANLNFMFVYSNYDSSSCSYSFLFSMLFFLHSSRRFLPLRAHVSGTMLNEGSDHVAIL